MKPRSQLSILLPALLLSLLVGVAHAASGNGIHDDGKFFSDGAIAQATKIIDQIDEKFQKDVLIETMASVPDDQKAQLEQEGSPAFFQALAVSRGHASGVNGIVIVICRDPGHLEVAAGKTTRAKAFTPDDSIALRGRMAASFKQKQFDQGLIDGVTFIQQQMASHFIPGARSAVTPTPTPTPTPTQAPSGNSFPAPRANQNWGIGGLACVVIAIVFGIIALRGIFGRSRGGYYPQQGGYYPQQGGGYPQQGGGYYPQQQGGSGFGRGFLGGLLGGAVGGYAADRWMHGGQQPGGGYVPPQSGSDVGGGGGGFGDGGNSGPDFGGGGEFTTGSDIGGGGGGGDFGGGGGGGDSGGGGGGSGGDF